MAAAAIAASMSASSAAVRAAADANRSGTRPNAETSTVMGHDAGVTSAPASCERRICACTNTPGPDVAAQERRLRERHRLVQAILERQDHADQHDLAGERLGCASRAGQLRERKVRKPVAQRVLDAAVARRGAQRLRELAREGRHALAVGAEAVVVAAHHAIAILRQERSPLRPAAASSGSCTGRAVPSARVVAATTTGATERSASNPSINARSAPGDTASNVRSGSTTSSPTARGRALASAASARPNVRCASASGSSMAARLASSMPTRRAVVGGALAHRGCGGDRKIAPRGLEARRERGEHGNARDEQAREQDAVARVERAHGIEPMRLARAPSPGADRRGDRGIGAAVHVRRL